MMKDQQSRLDEVINPMLASWMLSINRKVLAQILEYLHTSSKEVSQKYSGNHQEAMHGSKPILTTRIPDSSQNAEVIRFSILDPFTTFLCSHRRENDVLESLNIIDLATQHIQLEIGRYIYTSHSHVIQMLL